MSTEVVVWSGVVACDSVSVSELLSSTSSSHESAGTAFLILGKALESLEICSFDNDDWSAFADDCAILAMVLPCYELSEISAVVTRS